MSAPLYDCSVRTSVTTSNAAMVQMLPEASAVGTGRILRLRRVIISNTTATAYPAAIGIASGAGTTPTTAGTIVDRRPSTDPAAKARIYTTFATTPVIAGLSARFWVPASFYVVIEFPEGEELEIPPASTPLPFCVFNNGAAGQVSDVTLSWSE